MSSVLAVNRRESKLEVIIFSETIHNMLIDLMRRNFGIKNVDDFVRSQFAHGKITEEDFAYYRWQLQNRKKNIEQCASGLTSDLNAAYYRYPTSLHEYEIRRDCQNSAICDCREIMKELRKVVELFEVDVNLFREVTIAINREIDLIKRWRQRDKKYESNDLLQFAVSQGIIDLSLLETQIEMAKREQYLKQHPYEIWQGKNGSWYTYLPDKEKGRVLKRKSTRKAIEDEIVAYWRAEAENPTIREVFEEWNDYRLELKKISPATHLRNKQVFNRHYEEFGNEHIKDITAYDMEDFLERQIPKFRLTAKAFANLKTVTRGFLKRAKKRKLVNFNVEEMFQELDTSDSYFKKRAKEDCEEVFDDYEMAAMMRYLEENLDLDNIAILLMFLTGARVGEIVALKHSDFEDNTFKIRRTATRYKDQNGHYVYDIKENLKSQAGIRTAIIPEKFSWVTDVIAKTNPGSDYIFVKNGKPITTQAVRARQYRLCEKLGIYQKSPHKIRKTYGSILLDNHVDNLMIIQQMGHTDIGCTENHYHRNRKNIEKKSQILSNLPEFQTI